MSVLISCQDVSKTFGPKPLFSGLSIGVFAGDRLGVIGPNGSGKSTLLKILANMEVADTGTVALRKGTRVCYVPQDSHFADDDTIDGVLYEALASESADPHEYPTIIRSVLGKAAFPDGDVKVSTLSGGNRKRLSIARELVKRPDVLLMDEPTNHLDLEGIHWLEGLLRHAEFAAVLISHDRYFLENTTNRLVEINRAFPGGSFSAEGNYSEFLARKADFLSASQQAQESLANKVRREEEWLRRGPKARTTKSQARIDAAYKLKAELAESRSRGAKGQADIDFTASNRKTKRLLAVEEIGKSLGGKVLFQGLKFSLAPGMRLGLLGLNGSGKTTLLKILAGMLAPDEGEVTRADGLRVVYFDQNRAALDPQITLKRALAPESDSVVYRGRSIHVASWAKSFLFRPEQLDLPVGKLSGGEKARLQIANLMLEPADLLLLDEPTNDLDIETLETLEDSLQEFPGALVLVTHDRYMLDRVSTALIGLDPDAPEAEVVVYADYGQWEEARLARRSSKSGGGKGKKTAPEEAKPAPAKKLSYKEQREFDLMEASIHTAEVAVVKAQKRSEEPEIAANSQRLQEAYRELQAAQHEVERLYARWAELEGKRR